MTDYRVVESMQSDKPLEIDTQSSDTVYQRKNIRLIAASGKEGEEDYKPEHWEYEERKLSRSEYAQYVVAMEQAEIINAHSDQEAIDNYTRELMDEGVI